eukprot:964340-Pleurochrysis_carterae.AAC.2
MFDVIVLAGVALGEPVEAVKAKRHRGERVVGGGGEIRVGVGEVCDREGERKGDEVRGNGIGSDRRSDEIWRLFRLRKCFEVVLRCDTSPWYERLWSCEILADLEPNPRSLTKSGHFKAA